VLYLFKVYVLAAAVVFAMSGMVLAALAGWQEARVLSAASRRIMHSQAFANLLTNSRLASRIDSWRKG